MTCLDGETMDALTSKAYEALEKEILPKLVEYLSTMKGVSPNDRVCDEQGKFLISEASALLQLMFPWCGMERSAEHPASTLVQDDPPEVQDSSDDMSDEEAQKMMAEMEGSDVGTEPVEISDDDALALLADMDAPSSQAKSDEPMSDDEASKLLAAMDSPAASEKSDEPMSDDEASRLLADMDSSSSAPETKKEESSSDPDGLSSDAADLLAKLEAESDEPAAEPQQASPEMSETVAEFMNEKVEEIEEFGKSEFSSDPEMLKDFITNADELMENLDEQILALEQNPEDKEIINEIFRSAHTLKGAAGMFAFLAMERIMHRMENYFDQIAKGKQTVTSDAIDVILQSMDILKTLLNGIKNGSPSGVKTAPMVEVLNQLCAGQLKSGKTKAASPSAGNAAQEEPAKAAGGGNKAQKVTQSTIRVDLQRLDALVNLVGELVIDRTRFSSIEEQLRTKGPSQKIAGNMTETVQLFGRHMNEIQDIIMKVRMVPIGNAFSKFSRVVRDLAKSLEKEIDLITDGEQTELDKTIVEQIGDPLIHLIRNSVDHGVEDPATRVANGKKSRGTILLSARQEGNQIMITIEDDGKGIDKEIIRNKGIEKGLITEEDNLTDSDIFNLIFEPGFSTAAKVTNISGRGVGMDVVKKQISKLKGVIDISSKVNEGTTISIQLPLTLAIVQSLLVKSRNEIFAIPLSAVVESLRIKPNEIQNVGESEVIKRRDRVLPLLYLHDALDLSKKDDKVWYDLPSQDPDHHVRKTKQVEDRLFVVVVGTAERRFGLVVDTLLNQQEMVIKSMGNLMGGVPCVAGGAILGNGEVVLVLDIGELEAHFRSKKRQIAA